jgi:hypothetical protein
MARYALFAAVVVLLFLGVLAGFGFIIAAAYDGLSQVLAEGWAMLIVGAALVLLCCLDGLLIWALVRRGGRSTRPENRSEKAERQATGQSQAEIAQLLGREMLQTVEKHPKEASLAALGLGVALGASPGLRRRLKDMIE